MNNIAFNLSVEEYEREIHPEIIVKINTNYNSAPNNELTFDINFYKNGLPMIYIYRPIEYVIDLPDDGVYKLYYLSDDVRKEIPLEIYKSIRIVRFKTNQLSRFNWQSNRQFIHSSIEINVHICYILGSFKNFRGY